MTLVDQSVSTGSNSAVKSLPGTASMRVFGRLRAVILLAGVVRNTKFNESIHRSVLGLPLDPETSLIRHWYQQTCSLTARCGSSSLPLRVLVDPQSLLPVTPQLIDSTPLIIERDPLE